jgi:hypothetical protein
MPACDVRQLKKGEIVALQMTAFGPTRAEHGSSARVLQTSIFSAISMASSISMPR